jgi:hypothetical protein
MYVVAADGKMRETLMLSRESFLRWLLGIQVNRIKPALRDSVVLFQKEAQRVLDSHFFPKVNITGQLPETTTPVVVNLQSSIFAMIASPPPANAEEARQQIQDVFDKRMKGAVYEATGDLSQVDPIVNNLNQKLYGALGKKRRATWSSNDYKLAIKFLAEQGYKLRPMDI